MAALPAGRVGFKTGIQGSEYRLSHLHFIDWETEISKFQTVSDRLDPLGVSVAQFAVLDLL